MPSQRLSAAGPGPRDEPTPVKRGRTTQEMLAERRGPGFVGTLLRTLLVIAAIIALLALFYLVASVIEGDEPIERAPWADSSAPDVRPATLDDQ